MPYANREARVRRSASHSGDARFAAFRRLARMSGRDMLRNRLTGFASLFVFGWLLLLYVVLEALLTGDDGSSSGILRGALPSVLMCGIAALALMGTTVPLVAQRERGMLRLLGTTPLRRSTFFLAQLPARLVLIAAQFSVTLIVAALCGYLDGTRALRLAVTMLLGSAMCFAFALLFAARGRSAESSHHAMAFLSISLLFVSGGFLPAPPGGFPAPVEAAMHMLPSAWFASAMGADLTGVAPPWSVPTLWLLMAVATAAVGVIGLRRFEWDRERAASRRTPERPDAANPEPEPPSPRAPAQRGSVSTGTQVTS